MKMKFIALAVAAAIPATFVSAADVYQTEDTSLEIGGRVEVRGNFAEGGGDNFNDASRARLNVVGKQRLNSDVTFMGRYEFELKESEGDNPFDGVKDDSSNDQVDMTTRHLYAGVETSLGDLYYGHQNNAVTYLTNFTDMCETFCGYVNENIVTTADRSEQVLRYAQTTDGGLTFQLSGTFGAYGNDEDADGWGTAVAYALPFGLEVGVGYAESTQTYDYDTTAKTSVRKDSDAVIVAAKYAHDSGLYAAAMYQGGDISADGYKEKSYDAYDAYLGYNFGENNVNMTYSYFDADDIDDLDINSMALEYARYFGNATAYVSYGISLDNDDTVVGADNAWMLGLRYAY